MEERVPATDPPVQPHRESVRWFESGVEPLYQDERLATLMVRVGLALNALTAHMRHVEIAKRHRGATRAQQLHAGLVTSAAVTFEALRVAREGMKDLRGLAISAGAEEALVREVGRLCAGKHPAHEILDRARNQLGFHWDGPIITQSLRAYRRNPTLVWMEVDRKGNVAHRLAAEVLLHALLPGCPTNEIEIQRFVLERMNLVGSAMRLINEFFIAATWGYMRVANAVRRERTTTGPKRRRRKRRK